MALYDNETDHLCGFELQRRRMARDRFDDARQRMLVSWRSLVETGGGTPDEPETTSCAMGAIRAMVTPPGT
jgi:hypothetical protein